VAQQKQKPKADNIIEMMLKLRDLVNEPRTQRYLARNRAKWNKLCSAMDVIEDTAMAVRSYSSQEDTRDKGKLYLLTYGILQALTVQRDAVFDLCDALDSNRCQGEFPGLDGVRAVRLSVAGHPTKKQREGDGPYHLVQMSLGLGSFEVVSHSPVGPKFSYVDIANLIQRQSHELARILGGVIDDMKAVDAEHKAKFRGHKLEAVFPNTLSYSFEKIYEHIRGGHLAAMGVWGIEEVSKTLAEYRRALEARDIQIDTYDSIKYLYNLLSFPMDQLTCYLRKENSQIQNEKTAGIFAFFIEKHVEELKVIAKEIDKNFGS
jgi:hypothetical protein